MFQRLNFRVIDWLRHSILEVVKLVYILASSGTRLKFGHAIVPGNGALYYSRLQQPWLQRPGVLSRGSALDGPFMIAQSIRTCVLRRLLPTV